MHRSQKPHPKRKLVRIVLSRLVLTFTNYPKMKLIQGSIATDKTGSRCEFEFEMDDDATPEEIEEAARDAAFDKIDWGYTIDGQSPQ